MNDSQGISQEPSSDHPPHTMVYTINTLNPVHVIKCLRCEHPKCSNLPGWGFAGEGPRVCGEHATDVVAMVELVRLRCEQPECTRRATFGFDEDNGASSVRLCAAHQLDGMVDLVKRRLKVRNFTEYTT